MRRRPGKTLSTLMALLAAMLLQVLMGSLPSGTPRPEPFLLVVVAAGARWGSDWGGATGLAAGLLKGLVSPGLMGGFLLIYAGLGWMVGLSAQEGGTGAILLLLLTAAATVAVALGVSGLASWLGGEPVLARARAWMPGAMVCNLLLILPLARWMGRQAWRRR